MLATGVRAAPSTHWRTIVIGVSLRRPLGGVVDGAVSVDVSAVLLRELVGALALHAQSTGWKGRERKGGQ